MYSATTTGSSTPESMMRVIAILRSRAMVTNVQFHPHASFSNVRRAHKSAPALATSYPPMRSGRATMRYGGVCPSEQVVKDIRRATRKQYSAEEKIRIVLDGLRGESSIAELCRREGIVESLYYSWSKEVLEAGKRRLAGDTARAATSEEGKDLRRQGQELDEVVV